jgi:hypothetical protein
MGNDGSGRVFVSSRNRQKSEPKLPKGPTAIGMKDWLESIISPITSSGGMVRAVIGLYLLVVGPTSFSLHLSSADSFHYI